MKQVNVTTLRQNLPDYLAMVVEGETLSVTCGPRHRGNHAARPAQQ